MTLEEWKEATMPRYYGDIRYKPGAPPLPLSAPAPVPAPVPALALRPAVPSPPPEKVWEEPTVPVAQVLPHKRDDLEECRRRGAIPRTRRVEKPVIPVAPVVSVIAQDQELDSSYEDILQVMASSELESEEEKWRAAPLSPSRYFKHYKF